ncbi:hypothetical protein MA16_Dca007044 [Dendrobium catenatum]|uniref:Uncharacterized protein n=1 Tax=Dendrobium catenatum TaxID=906689 RepID=A0A2I0W3R5_9ASPA|nr:hypothetical protein MA16_Dca007044 [Dendrobium catenatum]
MDVAYDGSPFDSAVPALSPIANEEVPFVGVHISIISNCALKAHLGLNMKDACVDHSDWLDKFLSSPCGDVGEDLNGFEDEFNEMFNLKAGRIVQKEFSITGDKRCRQKPKRK